MESLSLWGVSLIISLVNYEIFLKSVQHHSLFRYALYPVRRVVLFFISFSWFFIDWNTNSYGDMDFWRLESPDDSAREAGWKGGYKTSEADFSLCQCESRLTCFHGFPQRDGHLKEAGVGFELGGKGVRLPRSGVKGVRKESKRSYREATRVRNTLEGAAERDICLNHWRKRHEWISTRRTLFLWKCIHRGHSWGFPWIGRHRWHRYKQPWRFLSVAYSLKFHFCEERMRKSKSIR